MKPVFKKEPRADKKNQRPIRILLNLSKIYENRLDEQPGK